MSERETPGARERLFVALQHVIPQHLLSRLVYHVTRSRLRPVKNALIAAFMHSFRPDMIDAAHPDPLQFPSFNEFFTRALRPGARAIDPNGSVLVSPVDGTISQVGRLNGTQLLQAKGQDYSLAALLGEPGWTNYFTDGSFATLYLAPFNYHRIHMPLGGELRAAWYIPGSLFSVSATTAAAVPGLFARNERVVCVFDSGPLAFAMVLVGALFVGSMTTVWHGEITPRRPRKPLNLPLDTATSPLTLKKGAEMGRFNMGSTVILLLPQHAVQWLSGTQVGSPVSVGKALARLNPGMMV
jgi:phosphatidylserine decarboxylase